MLFAVITLSIFWLPPFIVLIYQGLWANHNWQANNFSWKNIVNILQLDYNQEQRSHFKSGLKILALILTVSALFAPGNKLSYVGIGILIALWFNNTIFILQKVMNKQSPYFSVDEKSFLRIFAYITLLTIAVTLIFTYSFSPEIAQLQNSLFGNTSSYSSLVVERTSISLLGNLSLNNIASGYVFIVGSTILAAVWDLGSAVMFGVASSIALPFLQLFSTFQNYRVRSILAQRTDIKKIIVAGDHYTRSTTYMLERILGKHLNVVATKAAIDSKDELNAFISSWSDPNLEVAIIELNDAFSVDAGEVAKALSPDYLILTGIDEASAVFYGSYSQLLKRKRLLAESIGTTGTLILNIDDHDVQELAGEVSLKEIYVHTTSQAYDNLRNHELEVDRYFVKENNYSKEDMLSRILIQTQSQEIEIELQHNKPVNKESLSVPTAITLSVAQELGLALGKLKQTFYYLQLQPYLMSHYPTNNEAIFIVSPEKTNITNLKRDLTYLSELGNWDRYLVTKGLPNLGSYKADVYERLAEIISPAVQVLITFDSDLAEAVKNTRKRDLEIVQVKTTKEAIHQLSKRLEAGDLVLVNREIDPNLVRFFVDS